MKSLLAVAAMIPLSASVMAQETEQLSVATLNVDGLPQKILVFNINADGPGAEGSSRIGKYLLKKNYDIVCMQEDFNYHGVITPWLEDDYQFDEWLGPVGIDVPGKSIDFLHAQNERFDCDGLVACLKNDLTLNATERVPWEKTFGKFSHANDELVTKGFRRYHVTTKGGTRLVVYNMHMDAGDAPDEQEGKDGPDREARLAEWQQLTTDVLAHLADGPVIVMGDMNSYYSRDHVKANFIDAIAASGKGTASDAWVEKEKNSQYPAPVEGIIGTEGAGFSLDGEVLDKIIYINPVNGPQLKLVAFSIDTEGYKYDGKPLGDHFPVSATFQVETEMTATGVLPLGQEQQSGSVEHYNLSGQRVSRTATGLYIERDGKNTYKRIVK